MCIQLHEHKPVSCVGACRPSFDGRSHSLDVWPCEAATQSTQEAWHERSLWATHILLLLTVCPGSTDLLFQLSHMLRLDKGQRELITWVFESNAALCMLHFCVIHRSKVHLVLQPQNFSAASTDLCNSTWRLTQRKCTGRHTHPWWVLLQANEVWGLEEKKSFISAYYLSVHCLPWGTYDTKTFLLRL